MILTVASVTESRYAWHQHVPTALEADLSRTTVLAIADQHFDALPPDETALLEYVVAVIAGAVDDEIHDQLSRRFDDDLVVPLLFLTTVYVGIGTSIQALAVEPDGMFIGWKLEHFG